VRAVALLTFCSLAAVQGATLDPAALTEWDAYLQSAMQRMEQRAKPGACYLWLDESPERLARVRSGEIVVAPVAPQTPTRVASGLIHDWAGATFVPHVSLDEVLQVARDYSSFKDRYAPDVSESKTIEVGDLASGTATDRFSMLLIHKALSLKTAIDADYESRFTRLDDHRVYSVGHTTRMQEVADYGASGQRLLPEGTGHGLIWRLFGITRYLERDGGVYIEFEAIALSRDIPSSLRWLVEPMVRRLSRASLATSLRQTGKAVRERAEAANQNPRISSALSYKP
jgi:hypothetical protein